MKTDVSVVRSLESLLEQLEEAIPISEEFRLTAGLVSLQLGALASNDPEKWGNKLADIGLDLAYQMASGNSPEDSELDRETVVMMTSALSARLKGNGKIADDIAVVISGLAVGATLPKWTEWWLERSKEFGDIITHGKFDDMLKAMQAGDGDGLSSLMRRELEAYREELEEAGVSEEGEEEDPDPMLEALDALRDILGEDVVRTMRKSVEELRRKHPRERQR